MYHLNPDYENNFFTAMCQRLSIRVILAHSPLPKGRLERWNGIHQQRLIPLMKLDGVKNIEDVCYIEVERTLNTEKKQLNFKKG